MSNEPVGDHPYWTIPLFVISAVGRSGTLALRTALGAHPRIATTGQENNIVYDIAEMGHANLERESRRAAMQVSEQAYLDLFRRLVLDLHWPAERAREAAPPQRLMLMTDLTPHGAAFLRRAFAGMKMVYLLRNGIEVVASRMLHHGFRDLPFDEQCRQWRRAAEMTEWGEEDGDFLLARHENLLTPDTARAELARIFTFLKIAPDPACERTLLGQDFHPTVAPGEDAAAAHDRSRRAERWTLWTPDQQHAFRTLCGAAMARFGYKIGQD